MTKYEKRKNTIVGIIMYAVMILTCLLSCVSNIPTTAHGYATAYKWCYFIKDIILFFVIITALVIMLVKKRQGGFGVVLPMISEIFTATALFIYAAIQNEGYYFKYWTTYLLIIPIALVIFYFYVPNTPMKIISTCSVSIALIVKLISTLFGISSAISSFHYYSSMDAKYFLLTFFSTLLTLSTPLVLYSFIIAQVFISFKMVKGDALPSYASPVYAPAQSIPTGVPVQNPIFVQPSAPVQPVYQPPIDTQRAEIPDDKMIKELMIKRFCKLYEDGIITREEFEKKKSELLFDSKELFL